MKIGEFEIDTIDVSFRKKVLAGKMKIREAAVELHRAGCMPYIDEEWAKRIMKLTSADLRLIRNNNYAEKKETTL